MIALDQFQFQVPYPQQVQMQSPQTQGFFSVPQPTPRLPDMRNISSQPGMINQVLPSGLLSPSLGNFGFMQPPQTVAQPQTGQQYPFITPQGMQDLALDPRNLIQMANQPQMIPGGK